MRAFGGDAASGSSSAAVERAESDGDDGAEEIGGDGSEEDDNDDDEQAATTTTYMHPWDLREEPDGSWRIIKQPRHPNQLNYIRKGYVRRANQRRLRTEKAARLRIKQVKVRTCARSLRLCFVCLGRGR